MAAIMPWLNSWLRPAMHHCPSPAPCRPGKGSGRIYPTISPLIISGSSAAYINYRRISCQIRSPLPVSPLRYLKDLPALNQRRRHGRADEAADQKATGGYPDYFQQNFHFQTDGWFSEDSAALYDFQVEVLFVGGADAMRRQTFPALKQLIGSGDGKGIKLADIACGTGRYLREIRHNWPGLSLTGIDLSQEYLSHATRKSGRRQPIRYLQGLAEKLPLESESQDILTSIYLFHEVPNPVRREIAREFYRVLKPGGSLLFMDSIQIGDHEPYDALLDRFPIAFHEPYYADYIRDDMEGLFRKTGFELEDKERAFFSTGWHWRKPG